MNYIFRPYKSKDKKKCAHIIAPTWRFDTYFSGLKNADMLNTLVMDWFRLHSDYTDTAVKRAPDGDECVAFLFAEIKERGLRGILQRIKKSILRLFFYLRFFILRHAGLYGGRGIIRKTFYEYKAVQKQLFKDIAYDSEMLCLFVDEKARGQGLAKILLKRFFQWAEERDLKSVVLATDTDCNYRFYDKEGFTRMREMQGCLGVPHGACSNSRIFLYGIYLKKNQ